jgi:hypothetical protein
MYVYLQAYEPYAAGDQPVIAFVSLFAGEKKAFESEPVEVRSASANRLKPMPIQFTITLADLPPGKYDCQVTVLDPTGQKGAFWQAPVVIVP